MSTQRIKGVLCILALLFLCHGRFDGRPNAWADDEIFSVRSVYRDSASGRWEKEITWVFHVKDSAGVVVTREGRRDPAVTIHYSPDGIVEEVEDHVSGIHGTIEGERGGIVVSRGFPVPYDYLSPFDDSIKEWTVRKRAGGVTFSCGVTREAQQISLDEAGAEDMVDDEMTGSLAGKSLRMITVRRQGELLVRQLWPEGAEWWIYEETPVRRSWRTHPGRER